MNKEEKAMLERLKELQRKPQINGAQLFCPRCGRKQMDENPMRNALSRRADISICNECGIDEAMRDALGVPPLPLNQWTTFLETDKNARRCRVCGCTDEKACEGECCWAEKDLCSACLEKAKERASNMVLFGMMRGDIEDECRRRHIKISKNRSTMEEALIAAIIKELTEGRGYK